MVSQGLYKCVYSPSKKVKITVKKPIAKIISKYSKRLELDHIEQVVEGMAVIPDFGFNITHFAKSEQISE